MKSPLYGGFSVGTEEVAQVTERAAPNVPGGRLGFTICDGVHKTICRERGTTDNGEIE